MSNPPNSSRLSNASLAVLVYGVLVGLLLFVLYTTSPPPVSVPLVTTQNDSNIFVTVSAPVSVTVLPLQTASLIPTTVSIRPINNITVDSVLLSSNSSHLSGPSGFNVPQNTGEYDGLVTLEATHTGVVQTFHDALSVIVTYHMANVTKGVGPTTTLTVPLPSMSISMSDFPNYLYLFILSLGVVISRLLPLAVRGTVTGGANANIGDWRQNVVWIPFSVVVSLLIFTAFRQQVTLTTDIATNFALAFGFGFAFEKALSASPTRA